MRSCRLPIILCALLLAVGCRQNTAPAGGVTVTDANGQNVTIADASRIVSMNTSITETLYALGAENRIVGVDGASTEYIPAAANKPKVGSFRAIPAEGVLSLKPTLLICTAEAGPPEVISQLQAAGVTVLALPTNYTPESVKARVMTIAKALGLEEKGASVVRQMETDLADAAKIVAQAKDKPKVVFAGRGPNMPNATMSGQKTTIDTMITLAGGVNPITEFEGFRPMTDEAVVKAAPDVLLMTIKAFERSGGVEGVIQFPGVALTPAGKNKRVVAVSDMYFMGFGPGIGKATKELALKLHPELKSGR